MYHGARKLEANEYFEISDFREAEWNLLLLTFTKAFRRKWSKAIYFSNSWIINATYWFLSLSSDTQCFLTSPYGTMDITKNILFDCYSLYLNILILSI